MVRNRGDEEAKFVSAVKGSGLWLIYFDHDGGGSREESYDLPKNNRPTGRSSRSKNNPYAVFIGSGRRERDAKIG